jgi:hypothetical protein
VKSPNGRRDWYYSAAAAKEPLSRKHWLRPLEQKVTRHWVVNGHLTRAVFSGNRLTYSPRQAGELGLRRGDEYLVVIRKVDKENRERSELKTVQERMAEVHFPSSI